MAWKVLDSKVVFDNPYIRVHEDVCELSDGKKLNFWHADLPHWVMVAGFSEKNELVLISQYRHATKKELWELPAGCFNPNEEPMSCAKREFLEETGFELEWIKPLGTFFTEPGKSNVTGTFFCGRIKGIQVKQSLDDAEEIVVAVTPAKKVLQMVLDGKIESAPVCLCILLAKEKYPDFFN